MSQAQYGAPGPMSITYRSTSSFGRTRSPSSGWVRNPPTRNKWLRRRQQLVWEAYGKRTKGKPISRPEEDEPRFQEMKE
jgi:hypothetical protein